MSEDVATVQKEIILNDGTSQNIYIPERVPRVIGMQTREKIEIGVTGNQSSAEMKIENFQEKKNAAQEYLVSNILDNLQNYDSRNPDVDMNDLPLESVDKIWEYYLPQINGKKKESTETGSGTTSN